MVARIAAFEFSQRLRRISTYVYFVVFLGLSLLFVLMSGGAISDASVDFGTGGRVLVNSPFALNIIITFVTFFGVVVSAALAGQATYQDIDSNTTAFFYTAPITKFDYLAGRFLGCLFVQFLIFASVGLGAWAGTHMPWIDATRIGPQNFLAYFQPYFTLVIPNLILTSAIFFALAALGRKMLPVYAGSILLLIGYFVASQLSNDLTTTTLASLVDPFGGNAVTHITQYWTPFQRNTQLVPFSGVLVWNRLLWLGIGAAVLGFTYARFSFTYAPGKAKRQAQPEPATAITPSQALPQTHPTFFVADSFRELLLLTRLQFSETVKSVFFAVLVLAGALSAIFSDVGLNNPFSTPVYPVTWRMLEQGGGGFSLFSAIITFYSGELVWRERDAGLAQIMDALPVRRWVLFGSKLFALMLVQVLLVLMVMVSGLIVQFSHGYHHFEFGLYLSTLFGPRLVGFWILCVIAFLVHTIVNNKYLGHFVMVLYFIASIALPQMNFQDYLYRLGTVTANNVLRHERLRAIRRAYLLVPSLLGDRCGAAGDRDQSSLGARNGNRLAQAPAIGARALSEPAAVGIAVCALLFIAVGGYIYYNTHILNGYATTFKIQEAQAQYEIKYKQYQNLPQPRITDIQVDVDLYPSQRLAVIRGRNGWKTRRMPPSTASRSPSGPRM